MFFDGWQGLTRLIAVGIPAYLALLLLLRISGKRTLSKFNAFDLIVTVAFGSTLSAGLVNSDLSLIEVVGTFALLVTLQFAITWSSVRWHGVHSLVKSEPQLLYHDGRFLRGAMHRERVTEAELLAAVRSQGVGAVDAVAAIVLETEGTISVITNTDRGMAALRTVHDHPASTRGESLGDH